MSEKSSAGAGDGLSQTVVELSGNCPPSPKSRTNAFSRLSFDFVLGVRASRNRNRARRSPYVSDGSRGGFPVLAGLVDGWRGGSGDSSRTVTSLD